MTDTTTNLIERITKANMEIPAKGCRAQHATHGGHHKATFKTHKLEGEHAKLAQGLFATPREFPAFVRYSNGKEQSASEPDVHGLAIKVLADAGPRLLSDPDHPTAIDFIFLDVDTFFANDLGDYATVTEGLVPLLQRKQKDDDRFSFWEEVRGLMATLLSWRTVDDIFRVLKFQGDKIPINGVERWDLRYSSTTPFKLGDTGAVKYVVPPATLENGVVTAQFCLEVPRTGKSVDIEKPSESWANVADIIPVATLEIELGTAPDVNVERLRFNPWHAPSEHEPLGKINLARRDVYVELADKRQAEMDAA